MLPSFSLKANSQSIFTEIATTVTALKWLCNTSDTLSPPRLHSRQEQTGCSPHGRCNVQGQGETQCSKCWRYSVSQGSSLLSGTCCPLLHSNSKLRKADYYLCGGVGRFNQVVQTQSLLNPSSVASVKAGRRGGQVRCCSGEPARRAPAGTFAN